MVLGFVETAETVVEGETVSLTVNLIQGTLGREVLVNVTTRSGDANGQCRMSIQYSTVQCSAVQCSGLPRDSIPLVSL